MIRPARPEDAEEIASIYNHYVATTVITFDESPQPTTKFYQNIVDGNPYFVLEENGKITGFTYAVQWRPKNAYRFIYESTIYLIPGTTRKGSGTLLYNTLFEESRRRGLHSLIACIALPHDTSVNFHEKLGFKKVGHVQEAGFKFERWVDIGFWQLFL